MEGMRCLLERERLIDEFSPPGRSDSEALLGWNLISIIRLGDGKINYHPALPKIRQRII
jgi:hypothetical protein